MKTFFTVLSILTSSISMANTTQVLECNGTVRHDFDTRYLTISKNQNGKLTAQYSKKLEDGESVLLGTYANVQMRSIGINELEYSGELNSKRGFFILSGSSVNKTVYAEIEVNDNGRVESFEATCSR
jgi:hypothetical protein